MSQGSCSKIVDIIGLRPGPRSISGFALHSYLWPKIPLSEPHAGAIIVNIVHWHHYDLVSTVIVSGFYDCCCVNVM